jgi:outer membrane receptor protein involved in Fe transport
VARRRSLHVQPGQGEGVRRQSRARRQLPAAGPRHRGSLSVSYANPRFVTLSANATLFGRQFDDDQNIRTQPGETEPGLPAFGLVELSALRAIGRNLDVFLGVQNLFDQEYIVQLAPTTIGTPRLVHAGVRVRFAAR